ncbi:hypothetical protein TVAG_160870 [Trichomonas vaginalis G3]|uniref:Uncharacterized protein n=1 Tax=Trichomonas vaginalis (strain ATCC PRA-98 / G3) TaxID=412133 RepID=A2E4U2_TRIV3|nr:hypothetical protein TVAGG3_0227860 [Trichomonas vaginalis G3]EAY12281.1 hypothetical protein TVAG_160870 [Trichomonas vaginalis G3]KAI5552397.1 hypothetical protein TVAGG3_0227860 [Trichomonas vaginalis G3]|eukprot:XP_001324504.1 hypothetical protein [Trichomonas vaginalis G3]
MEQASLNDLGQAIINLSKSNHFYAQIVDSSLQSIKAFIVPGQNFDQVPNPSDPKNLPPQISQAQTIQPMMQPVQGPIYGQNLLAPMMGNQPYMAAATGNIPFLYHQQQ